MGIIWSIPTSGTKYSFGQCFYFLPTENTKTHFFSSYFHGVRNRNIDQKWVSYETIILQYSQALSKAKIL